MTQNIVPPAAAPGVSPRAERLGMAQMAIAMTMSGTLGFFVRESGQSPWNVVFFRCVFGALGLLAYCLARGLLRPGLFTRRTLGLALAAGVTLVLNWALLFSAYRLTSISLATAVYSMQPFMLIGLGVVFLGERPTWFKLAWSVIAFAGLLLVLGVSPGALRGHGDYVAGLALGLAAGASYAVTALLIKRLAGIPPEVVLLAQVCLGALLLLPLADFHALPASVGQWGSLLVVGLGHTSLMFILLYSALQKLPTSSSAPLVFIYPAAAILMDYVVYGLRLSAQQWLGVGLIFLGVAGVSLWGAGRASGRGASRRGASRPAPAARPGLPCPETAKPLS